MVVRHNCLVIGCDVISWRVCLYNNRRGGAKSGDNQGMVCCGFDYRMSSCFEQNIFRLVSLIAAIMTSYICLEMLKIIVMAFFHALYCLIRKEVDLGDWLPPATSKPGTPRRVVEKARYRELWKILR